MSEPVRLSPRQRDCLRLVYERQATSKEIATELGIGIGTVDNYIRDAVQALGARNRREAATMLFGGQARKIITPVEPTVDSTGVGEPAIEVASTVQSTKASRPWRTAGRPNDMSLGQTLLWIVAIGFGSLCALSLAVSVGNGLRPLAQPVLHAFDRLTR